MSGGTRARGPQRPVRGYLCGYLGGPGTRRSRGLIYGTLPRVFRVRYVFVVVGCMLMCVVGVWMWSWCELACCLVSPSVFGEGGRRRLVCISYVCMYVSRRGGPRHDGQGLGLGPAARGPHSLARRTRSTCLWVWRADRVGGGGGGCRSGLDRPTGRHGPSETAARSEPRPADTRHW